jgi:hypothetical protein
VRPFQSVDGNAQVIDQSGARREFAGYAESVCANFGPEPEAFGVDQDGNNVSVQERLSAKENGGPDSVIRFEKIERPGDFPPRQALFPIQIASMETMLASELTRVEQLDIELVDMLEPGHSCDHSAVLAVAAIPPSSIVHSVLLIRVSNWAVLCSTR